MNPDAGTPDMSAVTDMSEMFYGATSFNGDIGGWNTEAVTDMPGMFGGAALSPANYDSLLTGWNAQNLQKGVNFDAGESKYKSSAAHTARENMGASTDDGGHDWNITDDRRVQADDVPTNIFLSSTNIAENAGANAEVGMLSTNGGETAYTYTLITDGDDTDDGDIDNGSFNISGTSLRLTASADYETQALCKIRINASDGANDFTKNFVISIIDANENAPVFTSPETMDVAEGTTEVITVIATDADAGQTVTFHTNLSGADASVFSITSAGVLTFITAPDFENPSDTGMDNIYEVAVTATDGQTPPMTATQEFTITVTAATVLGLEKMTTGITVYPNPAGAVLHISGVEGNTRYILSNLTGKALKRGGLKAGISDHAVSVSSLKGGI